MNTRSRTLLAFAAFLALGVGLILAGCGGGGGGGGGDAADSRFGELVWGSGRWRPQP